eukprot:TRINITY_DN9131_c0_g1_i1.p1 TRINITY_DN9131_c0_g1~~TRINITY_DN9131_c0_g1_i1.p1  ORF type:complete len:377 (+),score=67.04 TRINITY_DN9131_c0_g1_i1:133-1263(+)
MTSRPFSQASNRSSTRNAASPPLPQIRQPFERMLDRRLQSVSTFVSSNQSLANSAALNFKPKSTRWTDAMPEAILFPSNKPSSRADAVVLDQWITTSLQAYAQRIAQTSIGEDDEEEDRQLSQAVEELVPILSIGLHEVVRQVTQHCLQRGVVLEKIWRTYVELFERALGETRTTLMRHREKAARLEAELDNTKRDLAELKEKHPEQIEQLSRTLTAKFSQRKHELSEQLRVVKTENNALEEHLRTQAVNHKTWFPLFDTYKDSSLREALSKVGPVQAPQQTPEARLAADYRRILGAMTAESRRRVGFFVSSLLGLRGSQQATAADTAEALTQRREHNEWKILKLQEQADELRAEIARRSGRSPESEEPLSRMSSN